MKRSLRLIAIGLVGLAALVLLAALGLFLTATRRLDKVYSLPDEPITLPTGAAALSRGKRLVAARCGGCHGETAEGAVIFQDAVLGTISAPNLTAGRGTGGAALEDADYVRAIRHGVDHTGRPILTMPSEYFFYINDADLGEMVAYIKSSPPIDHPLPHTNILPVGRVLIGLGAFGDLIAAEKIDHQAPRPAEVETAVSAAYGGYLVRAGQCGTCHGPNLTGGKDPDPDAPPAPDLTRAGELSAWSQIDFLQVFRSGKTPSGRPINQYMPWKAIGQMTDDELSAIWLYLQSLPSNTASK